MNDSDGSTSWELEQQQAKNTPKSSKPDILPPAHFRNVLEAKGGSKRLLFISNSNRLLEFPGLEPERAQPWASCLPVPSPSPLLFPTHPSGSPIQAQPSQEVRVALGGGQVGPGDQSHPGQQLQRRGLVRLMLCVHSNGPWGGGQIFGYT